MQTIKEQIDGVIKVLVDQYFDYMKSSDLTTNEYDRLNPPTVYVLGDTISVCPDKYYFLLQHVVAEIEDDERWEDAQRDHLYMIEDEKDALATASWGWDHR